jgi:hypothetical protein
VLLTLALIVALLGAVAIVRIVRAELRPSEIDRFREASKVTSAWARGEEPAAPSGGPAAQRSSPQRSSSPRQGLPRSSRT